MVTITPLIGPNQSLNSRYTKLQISMVTITPLIWPDLHLWFVCHLYRRVLPPLVKTYVNFYLYLVSIIQDLNCFQNYMEVVLKWIISCNKLNCLQFSLHEHIKHTIIWLVLMTEWYSQRKQDNNNTWFI
jgi:hypothetical protein